MENNQRSHEFKKRPCHYCGKKFTPNHSQNTCCSENCRFWQHVDKRGGEASCWNWCASFVQVGYGHFGRDNRKTELSHRMAMILSGHEIPGGMFVCHKCDNKKCCNPNHLFIGTPKDNVVDMFSKGRQQSYLNLSRGNDHYSRKNPKALARGSRHGNSKLTDSLVREIRERSKSESIRSIAASIGMSATPVHQAIKRKTWSHVE